MKRLIKPATWTAAVAVALVLVGTLAARRRTPVASAAPPAPEVSVLTLVPETVTARYEYVGQAAASRSVEVRSQVTGRHVTSGARSPASVGGVCGDG